MHTKFLKYVLDSEHKRITKQKNSLNLLDVIEYNRSLLKIGASCKNLKQINQYHIAFDIDRDDILIRIYRVEIELYEQYLFEFERNEKIKRLIKK